MLGTNEVFLLLGLLNLPGLIALVVILRGPHAAPERLQWILLVILLPLLGPALYYFIGRPTRRD